MPPRGPNDAEQKKAKAPTNGRGERAMERAAIAEQRVIDALTAERIARDEAAGLGRLFGCAPVFRCNRSQNDC